MFTRARPDPRASHQRRFAVVLPAVLLIALLFPSGAPAAVTLGSDLSTDGAQQSCFFGDCTIVQTSLPGRQVASPIDGVAVLWRVRNASSAAPVRFRVVRPAAGGAFTGAGSALSPGFTCAATCSVKVRLPIKSGDYIGLDGPAGSKAAIRSTAGAGLAAWNPYLGDGETRSASGNLGDSELLLNADVEADADKDGFGDETQDFCSTVAATQQRCGRATIGSLSRTVAINVRTRRGNGRVRCTNVPEDVCRTSLAVTAQVQTAGAGAARKRTVKLGTATASVAGGKAGPLRFKLSRSGVARLRKAGRLRVQAAGSSRNRTGSRTTIKRRLTLKASRKG